MTNYGPNALPDPDECPCAYDRAEDCTVHGPRYIDESEIR